MLVPVAQTIAIVVLALVLVLPLVGMALPDGLPSYWAGLLVETAFFLAVGAALFALGRHHQVDFEGLIGKPLDRSQVVWLAAFAVPLTALNFGLFYLVWLPLSYLLPGMVAAVLDASPSAIVRFRGSYPIIANSVQLGVLAFLGPLVEEFVFRGFIYRRLLVLRGFLTAAIASSLLFGILHFDICGAAVEGVVLVLAYRASQSLWAPIILHGLANLNVWLIEAALTVSDKPLAADPLVGLRDSWEFGLVGLLFGVPWLVWFLRTHWPKLGSRNHHVASASPLRPKD